MASYLSFMTQQSCFSTTSPLPTSIAQEKIIQILHSHAEMIHLNPMVVGFQKCNTPACAPQHEHDFAWYEITDRVSFLPFGVFSGKITYHAGFHDLPTGLETHVYAPMGLDTKTTWTVNGHIDALYLKEDVDMRCHFLMTNFVKNSMKQAHEPLTARLISEAEDAERITR
ncbi:hypothetical protein BDV25DRAFT_151895 [Aspergillus avenaceus]|uniref:DUF7053 domain-containing protein n=1 Tax=Aspergillus avenaceus TaxID=36643 RepID=A0A5N6U022_ASPAV|nr:hypothetical protein BDV25DRAFT_151895 [Aspergillus avenaceus]